MIFSRSIFFLKIIPVFIFIQFNLSAQKVITDDLTKGKWYVEGDLKDSIVKLNRKRNVNFTFRQYVFVPGTVLQRCDSVYQSAFDINGNETMLNKLDCNSPATYGVKNLMLMVSTGSNTYYFIIEPKKGGGAYTLKRSKAEFYYQQ